MSFGVDLDHTNGDVIAFFEDFLGVFDTFFADFGDVDQTFEIVFDFRESTEFGQTGNFSIEQIADVIFSDRS